MAKLVEELRNARIMGVEEMCWQAADEIERLRARIVEHEQFRHQHHDCDAVSAENQSLRARVAELEFDLGDALLRLASKEIKKRHADGDKGVTP